MTIATHANKELAALSYSLKFNNAIFLRHDDRVPFIGIQIELHFHIPSIGIFDILQPRV
jgi:hypothetical protein